jgi:DNA (cytosine-5)-methyltransferase 1
MNVATINKLKELGYALPSWLRNTVWTTESGVTISDFFCGAGGESEGADNAGAEVVLAVNHWQLAIDTHSANHPDADHRLDDIQRAHPSQYPRTNILWMSPECTNHSIAKGKRRKGLGQLNMFEGDLVDPSEEKSRATMREVVEYTSYHRYEYVVVENVVDVRHWQYFDAWLQAMIDLGYEFQILYLNSMFFSVPQSRDRIYIVFWRKGMKKPNLDFRPDAWCGKCAQAIEAVQVFKKTPNWGRYGTKRQYTYRCPTCGQEVHPPAPAAAQVIDWTDLGERIADRKAPLKPKTMERIRAGIRKFTHPFVAPMRGTANPHSVNAPLTTIIASAQQQPLITPFTVETMFTHSDTDRNTSVEDPLRTLTSRQSQGFVCPPFLMQYYGREDAQSGTNVPLPVIPTEPRHSLVIPPMMLSYYNQETEPRPVSDPMYTVAGSHTPRLVIPPFLSMFYGSNTGTPNPVDGPMPTVMDVNHHGLVIPFLTSYNGSGDGQPTPMNLPMWTIPTVERHALVNAPLSDGDVEELVLGSYFRMLKPNELKRGMSFHNEYIILGSQRDQTKQIGNAVTPHVAQWIIGRLLETYRVS